MSITDELREWWVRRFPITDKELHNDFVAIAGRIDATNETAMSRAGQLLADVEKDRDYNYANWQDCKQKVLHHNITIDELDAEIERLKDELAHCIELPKDADGVPIHIGDVMEWPDGETFEVIGIGDDLLFYVKGNDDVLADWTIASTKRHHGATVEDVLREFTDAILEWSAKSGTVAEVGTWSDVAAEYAAKLRLAGDAE